jgi:hypothetical protein
MRSYRISEILFQVQEPSPSCIIISTTPTLQRLITPQSYHTHNDKWIVIKYPRKLPNHPNTHQSPIMMCIVNCSMAIQFYFFNRPLRMQPILFYLNSRSLVLRAFKKDKPLTAGYFGISLSTERDASVYLYLYLSLH